MVCNYFFILIGWYLTLILIIDLILPGGSCTPFNNAYLQPAVKYTLHISQLKKINDCRITFQICVRRVREDVYSAAENHRLSPETNRSIRSGQRSNPIQTHTIPSHTAIHHTHTHTHSYTHTHTHTHTQTHTHTHSQSSHSSSEMWWNLLQWVIKLSVFIMRIQESCAATLLFPDRCWTRK